MKPPRPTQAVSQLAPIAAAAALALGAGASAQAQAPQPEEGTTRIVITGSYARSIEAAQALKREAVYGTDAVNAEDIGKFPSQNAAEAIQLVTGVTITRQRGEGLYVNVRGLDPRFQNVTLNGRSIATNDVIENSGVQGRNFRFEVLPSEFLSQMEVVKTPTADMVDGAIGGNIDVKTFKPLDVGNRSQVSLRGAYNTLTEDTTPTVSGLLSWVNGDRSFGALITAMRSEREVRNDRFMGFGWNLNSFSGARGPLPAGLYTPTRTRPTIELESRERTSVAATLQWRPTKALETTFDLLYSRLDVQFNEYGMDIYPDITTSGRPAPTFVSGSERISGDTVTAGTINNVRWMASHESSMNRHDLKVLGLMQSWKQHGWSASVDLSHSEAHSYHPGYREATVRSRAAYFGPLSFDYGAGYKNLPTLSTDRSLTDPANFVGQPFEVTLKDSLDTDTALRLDLGKAFSEGWLRKLSAGLQTQRREREYKRRDFSVTSLVNLPLPAGYLEPMPVQGFLSGDAGNTPRTWASPVGEAYYKGLVTDALLSRAPSASDLRNGFVVTERTQSIYGRMDFDTQLAGLQLDANVGLRYARTEQTAAGHQTVGSTATPVSFDKTYDAVLPTLNLRLELSPTLVSRFALSRVITRPNLVEVAPRLTVSSDTPNASGGNPNLEPFLATMADVALEWYLSKTSSITTAFFHKKFDDYITRQNSTIDVPGRGAVTLSSNANGGDAALTGVELAFQHVFSALPAPFNGLGVQGSVTAVDVKSNYNAGARVLVDEFPGLSKVSANLVGFYERGPFAARLGYFWRDKYLSDIGTSVRSPSTRTAFGSLDGQISWQINPTVGVFVEAINLTDAKQYEYANDPLRGLEINHYGRTFSFGLKAKF